MADVIDLNRGDKKRSAEIAQSSLKTEDVRLYYTDKKNQERLSEEVRSRLRKLIEDKAVTLEQIATALKIEKNNKSTISHLLNGRTKLGLFQLLDLSSVLNVDIRELLYGTKEEGTDSGDEVMHGANFEGAWQYISSELDGLDANEARALAMQTAKNLGAQKSSEQEIRREINRILVSQLKGASAPKS